MKIKRNDRDECIYIETRRKRKEKEELRKEKKIFQYHPRRVGAREKGGREGAGIALLSGIFRRIRDGIIACPVPMQS